MAASDDFKALIRAGKLAEALKTALSESIELDIATWVSLADPYGTEQQNPESALPGHRMKTRINIVDGDINTEVGSVFVDNSAFAELREFHISQIKASHEIIQRNLLSLQKLFSLWIEMQEHNFDPSSLGLDWSKVTDSQLAAPSPVREQLPPSSPFDESQNLAEFPLDDTQAPLTEAFPVHLEVSAPFDEVKDSGEFTATLPPETALDREAPVSDTGEDRLDDRDREALEEFDAELFADSFDDETEESQPLEPLPTQASMTPPVDPLGEIFDREDTAIATNLPDEVESAVEPNPILDRAIEADLQDALQEEIETLEEISPTADNLEPQPELETEQSPEALKIDSELLDEFDAAEAVFWEEETPEIDLSQEDVASPEVAVTPEENTRLSAIEEQDILSKLNGTDESAFWEAPETQESPDEFDAETDLASLAVPLTDSALLDELGDTEEILDTENLQAFPEFAATDEFPETEESAIAEDLSPFTTEDIATFTEEIETPLSDDHLLGDLSDDELTSEADYFLDDEQIQTSEASSPFAVSETELISEEQAFSPFDLSGTQAEDIEELPEFNSEDLTAEELGMEDDSASLGILEEQLEEEAGLTEEAEWSLTDEALLEELDNTEDSDNFFVSEENEDLSPFESSEMSAGFSELPSEDAFAELDDLADSEARSPFEELETTEESEIFSTAETPFDNLEETEDFGETDSLFVYPSELSRTIEEVSPFEIEEESQAEFSSPFEDLETLETTEESEIFSTAETPFDNLEETEDFGETDSLFVYPSELSRTTEEVSPFEIEEEPQAEFSSPFEDLETLETAEESEAFSTAETPFDNLEETEDFGETDSLFVYPSELSRTTEEGSPFEIEGESQAEFSSPFEDLETLETTEESEAFSTAETPFDNLEETEDFGETDSLFVYPSELSRTTEEVSPFEIEEESQAEFSSPFEDLETLETTEESEAFSTAETPFDNLEETEDFGETDSLFVYPSELSRTTEEVSPFEIEEEPQAEFSSPFEDLETLETAEESEIFSTAETPFDNLEETEDFGETDSLFVYPSELSRTTEEGSPFEI
ncbi:hypothetical protein, partial [Desertifilum sp. FACHB-868]|uniref:hypothetical protein n=1 Tax=Desertifilum sp. FACHB-868 TaxID=2692797 RepID=UPI001689B4D5